MTSAYPNQPIAPKTQKPLDYIDIPLIKSSIDVLDGLHNEYDVARVILSVFTHYFTSRDGWSIVPEFRVLEKKRPDFIIELRDTQRAQQELKKQFVPKIAVELKSGRGDNVNKALDQSVDSLVTLVDNLAGDFSIYIIILRGKSIGFFEYHNDRSNLYEEGVRHHRGAIPFNLPQQNCPPGRPTYRGTGTVTFQDEYAEANERLPDMANAFLLIEKDSPAIQNVLNWMKHNPPLSGPGS